MAIDLVVAQFIQTEAHFNNRTACSPPATMTGTIAWLQGITLVWMLVECGVSLYGAVTAHSSALLAFGADSFVELLSATVVLLALVPSFPLTKDRAARLAGVLLFVLAGIVALVTVLSLLYRVKPETSCNGIAITFAALIVMPILAWAKRRTAQRTNNRALAADAVQSATCAYLALITLAGLAINAVWHISWVDSAAALLALPILIVEGRRALHGESCGCC
ncbi:cation transporter [Tunturiibacter gelidoferens]|uniref:Divalent metal cation (Fe/Co/Zn/Cd) transporter n=1 Tax=Tunturiibacter lichenicola TaxID=2051959 RepID=A0A7Y9NKL6_9BACT|nr:cation transporter [Edaphobacter lichenicola]NYF51115.1 divalent metal cation (Fe/Co/Zn/Cd) transporter [Edaphobacter lichenicola]